MDVVTLELRVLRFELIRWFVFVYGVILFDCFQFCVNCFDFGICFEFYFLSCGAFTGICLTVYSFYMDLCREELWFVFQVIVVIAGLILYLLLFCVVAVWIAAYLS